MNFQKSGPNSPPLPETMPPPSWGAQGTRDVSSAPGNLFWFILLSSKIILKGVEGPQLPDNPWLARNNHRSTKLGSHICKRWTGAPSSPDIDIFCTGTLRIKVLEHWCLQVARGDRSSTLPIQVHFCNISFDLILILWIECSILLVYFILLHRS